MTGYADVFVIPVPNSKTAQYRELAETSAQVWREAGALSYVEFAAEDVKRGKVTSFPQSVDLGEDEQVIVAVIGYRSRDHRDEVNAKAMADARMAGWDMKSLPFDGKRMFYGGFRHFVGDHAVPATPAATHIAPYLFFRGRCEEAIDFYRGRLGAKVEVMLRFRDFPGEQDRSKVPVELDDRIMHAGLTIAGTQIMMSDGMKTGPLDFGCMSLSITVPDEDECDRIFNALAEEGSVQMPIGPAFFAKRFGSVTDKFGVSWMVIVPAATH